MVSQIQSGSIYKDTITYFRDVLKNNLVDPISGARPTNSSFVMTSYPTRQAIYPVVIVKAGNFSDSPLGMQSEVRNLTQEININVDARNVSERDQITQQVYNLIRLNQYGAGSETINFGLHDYKLVSSIPIDKPNNDGTSIGLRSQEIKYKFFTIIE